MNRTFFGLSLAASFALAMLTSCSDDGSSSGTQTEEVSDLTPMDTNPGSQTGEQGENAGEAGNGAALNDPDEPEENIADQPITEEDLKDDGTASVTSLNVDISGVAEFGPFADGASVTVKSVDVSTMTESGTSLTAKVAGNLGAYKASGSISSAVASVEVKGGYLNFTLDEASQTATGLKALSDLRERNKVNVNVLTRLEYDRVQYLVSNLGLSFTAAKTRAEKEVLAALGFKQDSTMFEDISLYDRTRGGAYLLAITTIVMTDRSASDADADIAAIAADIAVDGTWDDDALKASLADKAFSLDTKTPVIILSEKNGDVKLENFSGWVNYFWAAQYGLGFCGENNQDQLKPNSNSYSVNASFQFICRDSAWMKASDILLEHLAATELFGPCSESNVGAMNANAEGKYYICKKNTWLAAGAADIENMKVAESKGACNSAKEGALEQYESNYYICISNSWQRTKNVPIDYSKGAKMNKRLGRGINLGNAWESTGNGATADCGWSNCIQDNYFKIVKDAGFNSVRLPVRWNQDASNSSPYTLNSGRLSGVKADIDLALAQGLAVIVNFHHYTTLNDAAAKYASDKNSYESEKKRFLGMWEQVAKEMNSYPDSLLVLEIFNEPHDMKNEQVNDLMSSAYEVIRKNAPGKTIMFEGNAYSKFAQIRNLDLPADGNIIVSGHYYESYAFTHQGHGYDCNNNLSDNVLSAIPRDFKSYVDSASFYYPDVNGGHVPMNMGEFGVSGQHGSSCGGSGVSDDLRAKWTDAVIGAAEKYGMSWQYWGFVGVGGFEAYDKNAGKWYPELLQVFNKYTSN